MTSPETSEAIADATLDSPEFFRLVAENAAVGMCLTCPDSRFLWVNRAICTLLGRDEQELLGLTWHDITHPDDLGLSNGVAQRLLAGEAPSHRTMKRYLRRDGSTLWGDLSVAPLRGPDGRVRLFIAQIVDATQAVLTRENLACSEERYRLLAENASDVVTRADNNGILQWISPSVKELTGWEPEELVGRSSFSLTHPDDLPAARRKGGQVADGTVVANRLRVRCADGTYRWIGVTARPIADADGRVIGRVAGWRDAAAEVAAEQALAASEEHYRLLAENSSDVIIKTDAQERIEWVSPSVAAVLGWRPAELVGTALDSWTSAEDADDSSQPPRRREIRFRTAGAGWRWMLDARNPLPGRGNGPAGFIHSLRDTHREHEAREKLRFLAYHDPLTRLATRAVAEELLDELLSAPGQGGPLIALLFVDVDGLKAINDEFGHSAGDCTIHVIAQRLLAHARADDLVARFGGDEFVVVLPAIQATSDALGIAERMRRDAAAPISIEGRQVWAGVSVGVAVSAPGSDPADLLRRADAALYRAKRAGRNRAVLDDASGGWHEG